jgi:hypothetical protein
LPSKTPTISPQLEPQFDPGDPEGFLRWFFLEVWTSRNYNYLWTYLSKDFTDRLGVTPSSFEDNWSAIGSIEEPIDIAYQGKNGGYLQYRVQYTTWSLNGKFSDHRNDLYSIYFNQSIGHWEFR